MDACLPHDIGASALNAHIAYMAEPHVDEVSALQGRGVGTALMAKVKQLRPHGFTLWTHQSNEGARRFYEREGLVAVEFTDGATNEEKVPDVRYEWR